MQELQWSYTYPPLQKTMHTNVLIIGGGIRGLLAGYFLSKMKTETILVEKNLIASGRTRYLPGFLDKGISTDDASAFSDILRIDKIIHQTPHITMLPQLIITKQVLQSTPGHTTVLKNALLPKNRNFRTSGIFIDKNAATLDPVIFCKRLAAYTSLHGVSIHENTTVQSVISNCAKTDYAEIYADIIMDFTSPPYTPTRKLWLEFERPKNCDIAVTKNAKSEYIIYPYQNTVYCIGQLCRQQKYRAILSRLYGMSPTPKKAALIHAQSFNPIPKIVAEIKKLCIDEKRQI